MLSIKKILISDILVISSLLYIGLSSAYLTSITKFSPYYVGFFSCVFCITIYFTTRKCESLKKLELLKTISVITFVFFMLSSFFTNTTEYIWGTILLFFINQGSVYFSYFLCKKVKDKRCIFKAINFYFYVTIIIGFADFVFRIINRNTLYTGIQYFYNFKLNSLMFTDSNWSGFIFMISFAFFFYLRDKFNCISSKKLLLLFVVVFLTFSRTAIICSFIVIFLSNFFKLEQRLKSFISFLCIFLFFCGIPVIISVFSKDDSFGTKLALMKGLWYYISNFSFEKVFFGSGLRSNGNEALLGNCGYASHLYLVVKILDYGIFGLILDLLFFFEVLRLSKRKFLYVFIPFIFAGLSMCPTNLSFMYVFIGIMIFLEGEKNGFNFSSYANLQCRKLCGRSNRINIKSIIFKYRIRDC